MVYYIYHSAFVIEQKKSILIFDFYRFPSNKKKEKEEFFNRFIKRTDKKVYVFSTHSHSDHFNKEILTWLEMNENIKYILSDDIKIHKHKNFYFTKEDDSFELDNLKIRTFGSTDLGSSFYVKQSIDTFGVHPFMCPYCKIMMDIQKIYVSSVWYGRTIHKVYF